MSESFSFESEMKDCSMPKEGKKGKYYVVKTDKGIVNVPVDAIEGAPSIGKVYSFGGIVSEYERNGEKVKSKWASKVVPLAAKSPEPGPIPGIGEKPSYQNLYQAAAATGQAINGAIRAYCQFGKPTPEKVEAFKAGVNDWYPICRELADRIQADEVDRLQAGF